MANYFAYTGGWFRLHMVALLLFLLPHITFFVKTAIVSDKCDTAAAAAVTHTQAESVPAAVGPSSPARACGVAVYAWVQTALRSWVFPQPEPRRCEMVLVRYGRHLIDSSDCWVVWLAKLVTGVVLLLYNAIRAALVWQALTLADKPRFSFRKHPRWGWLFRNYKRLFLFNAGVVVVHLGTFLFSSVQV